MQERDDTFQTLFSTINDKVKKARRPGVVVAHSLGNRLFQSWLRWVEHEFYKEVVAENAAPDCAAEEWSTWFSSFIWEEGSVNPTEEVRSKRVKSREERSEKDFALALHYN